MNYKQIGIIGQISEALLQQIAFNNLIPALHSNLERQATRAAISQVMARNMSHNIGSHVLSKFKDKTDIQNINLFLTQYQGESYEDLYKAELDSNEQIAYFNEYLKNRMDFLADIATSDPVMESAMMLKNDVFRGFDRNRILLNRISGISDKDLKFKIVLKEKGKVLKDDISLSITNDILGSQAFYILLENIIRNVAKHSKAKKVEKRNIVITIDFNDFEYNKSFYEISIYDNLKRKGEIIDGVVRARNKAFNKTVLNASNQLRDNNLGTIEMDVCAAYLRCLTIISIEDDKYELSFNEHTGELKNSKSPEPKLLFAYKHTHDKNNNKYSLGYKLYISKPKEVLVVDNGKSPFRINNFSKKQLLDEGIQVVKPSKIDGEHSFKHQILYCHSPFDNKSNSNIYSSLPKRVVEKISDVNFANPKDFIKAVWEKYAVTNFLKNEASIKIQAKTYPIVIQGENNKFKIVSNTDSNSKTIYIDDHNEEWKNRSKYDYYDFACSHSKIDKKRKRILNDEIDDIASPLNSLYKSEYLEVVFCKVLIIDERIQENIVLNKKYYSGTGGETPFYEYFLQQNVIIPTKTEADLNNLSFGTLQVKNSISCNIKKFISDNIHEATFCVIHLGILEKMMDAASTKDIKATDSILKKLIPDENERRKLIITSGRGKPNNLSPDISFVPLALIQNAIETVFDKYVLTKILYNSRKPILV